MRSKFNLDEISLNGFTLMIHGDRAVGKTHFLGDMLLTESKFGKVKYINITGEDGMLTISNLGLGNIGETITEYSDLIEILNECAKDKYQAIGIDSLQMFVRLAMKKVTGSDRLPIIPSRDQLQAGMKNEWPDVHRLMEDAMIKARASARYVGVVASSDKAVDMLDTGVNTRPTMIAPNLPGKEASDSAGWFDFVAYLKFEAQRPGKFSRKLVMVPDGGFTKVRQRVPKLIVENIILPEGAGGWQAVKDTIEKACQKGTS